MPTADQPAASIVTQFSRFWSANMDQVHSTGANWPGFGYTAEEKAAMHAIAQRVPLRDFLAITLLVVIFTLVIATGCIVLMFAHLQARYGSDPSKTPEIEFFFCLFLACITTVAGGMPLAILAGSWLVAKVFPAAPDSLPDPTFARHLFTKAVGQIIRITLIMGALVLILWLFVPTGSKVDMFLRLIVPTLGPVVSILTGFYYYGRRIRQA